MSENKNNKLTDNSEVLVECTKVDDEEFIEALLLEENTDFDEKILENSDEGSIFHIAAKNNNTKIFRLFYKSFPELLPKVINNKIITENNDEITEESILDIVAENGNIELINFILSQDNVEYNQNLITHLIKGGIEPIKIKEIVNKYNIAKNIKPTTIDALLGLNDEYNNKIRQNTNYNLLNYAIDNDDFDGLKFLLTSNNDLQVRNKFNDSFFYAWETSKKDITELLINDPNFNVNEQDNEGNTLFHYAVLKNDSKLVKFLISRGVATDIENKQKLNPLGFLLENNKDNNIIAIANVLADKNAVKSIRDNFINKNIQEMVKAQIRAGYTANNVESETEEAERLNRNENNQAGTVIEEDEKTVNIKKLAKNYNSSGLGSLYKLNLRPLLVDYCNEVDDENDPIYLLLDGIDKILKQKNGTNLEIWEKIGKICEKIGEVKDNVAKSFLCMKEEDFDTLKKIFSIDEVKKKMKSLSDNLYEVTVGDFFLNTIKDVKLFKEKIRNVFAIEENETKIDSDKIRQLVFYNSESGSFEVNADILMDLMPFNENNEIDMKRLTKIVDYAYNILNEDDFNTLIECLKENFGWEPVFEINETAIEENETKIDSDKIRQLVFYNSESGSFEVNADILIDDLMPFNENNEIDMKRLTKIVDYAYNILNEDDFNTLTECLKENFGWEPVFEINETNLSKLVKFTKNGRIKNEEVEKIINAIKIVLPEYEYNALKEFIELKIIKDINEEFYDGFGHGILLQ